VTNVFKNENSLEFFIKGEVIKKLY